MKATFHSTLVPYEAHTQKRDMRNSISPLVEGVLYATSKRINTKGERGK